MSLVTYVGMQLSQQKFIAEIPGFLKLNKNIKGEDEILSHMNKLRKTAVGKYVKDPTFNAEHFINSGMKSLLEANGKEITKFTNITRGLSSTYMAITSAGDAWAQARKNGHDERRAGMITLGTMAGLFSIFRFTNIGDIMIRNIGLPQTQMGIRQAVREAFEDLGKAWTKRNAAYGTAQVERNLFNKFKFAVENFGEKLKNAEFSGFLNELYVKSVAEGVEEVSEEMVADGINVMANMGMFGKTEGKYNFNVQDFISRYSMSFFGGMIGGGMHVGIERIKNRPDLVHKSLDKETRQQLEYLTYKYGPEAVKTEIQRQYDKGKLPLDKTFSMEADVDENGNHTPKVAKNEEETIAWNVKEAIKNQVDSYSSVMRGFTEGMFDDDMKLATRNKERMGEFLKLGSRTNIKTDYMNAVDEYVSARMEIASIADGGTATSEQNSRLTKSANELDKFRQGEYFENYAEQALFILDKELSGNFVGVDRNIYSIIQTGKAYNDLSTDEKAKVDEDYIKYAETDRTQQAKQAFNLFKNINSKFSQSIGQKFQDFAKIRQVT